MRLFIFAFLCLLFSGCELQIETTPSTTPVAAEVIVIDDYCAYQYDEPYYWSPEWCDWYDDGTTCCVWYYDGWYEEWCQWEYDWCWEYQGFW